MEMKMIVSCLLCDNLDTCMGRCISDYCGAFIERKIEDGLLEDCFQPNMNIEEQEMEVE